MSTQSTAVGSDQCGSTSLKVGMETAGACFERCLGQAPAEVLMLGQLEASARCIVAQSRKSPADDSFSSGHGFKPQHLRAISGDLSFYSNHLLCISTGLPPSPYTPTHSNGDRHTPMEIILWWPEALPAPQQRPPGTCQVRGRWVQSMAGGCQTQATCVRLLKRS